EEQFMLWRRSYDTPPPPLARDDEYSQFDDPRYATLPPEVRPDTECLKDVVVRMLPYWFDSIVPDLLTGRTVLVAAHG
ncbi:2,3-bisphosphoglycerate-dependent phosphoglycerate mutase, partial [Streptomyces sp. SID8455]|nr:2,3-bisphosphoglycerate-dependent phosphoglycerate mutase [Streptomyces sp. SID8455]